MMKTVEHALAGELVHICDMWAKHLGLSDKVLQDALTIALSAVFPDEQIKEVHNE